MITPVNPHTEFEDEFVDHVRAALRQTGRLLPMTDSEVEKALEAIESEDEQIQGDLSDPYELFDTGKSESDTERLVKPHEDHFDELQDSVERSMALAAREGREISFELRKRMDLDRRRAERERREKDTDSENGTEDR